MRSSCDGIANYLVIVGVQPAGDEEVPATSSPGNDSTRRRDRSLERLTALSAAVGSDSVWFTGLGEHGKEQPDPPLFSILPGEDRSASL